MGQFFTLLFTWVGYVWFGPVGALVGSMIGQALFGTMSGQQEGPRLTDLRVQSSAFGTPLALTWGSVRLSCNIIWSPGIRERAKTVTQGGGLFGGGMDITTYEYFFSGAFALCDCRIGPITTVRRIWANNILIYDATVATEAPEVPVEGSGSTVLTPIVNGLITGGWTFALHTGTADQAPDEYIEANRFGYDSPGAAPAYRKTAYIVIKNLPLQTFGNQVPQFEFEIIRGTPNPERYELLDDEISFFAGGQNSCIDFVRETIWSVGRYQDTDYKLVLGVDPWAFRVTHRYITSQPIGGLSQCDTLTYVYSNAPSISLGPDLGWTYDLRYGATLFENVRDNAFHWIGPVYVRYGPLPQYPSTVAPNGLFAGVEWSKTVEGWRFTWDWWSNGGSNAVWGLFAYSTLGGQRLYRAEQEAFPLVGEYYGRHIWIVGGLDNAFDPKVWWSINGATEYLVRVAYNSQGEPAIAHDRTRDRVWVAYTDNDNGGRATVRYLDTLAIDGYSGGSYANLTSDALGEFDPMYGVQIAYNPDLDWLLVVGMANDGSPGFGVTLIHAFDCSPTGLASGEPVYTLRHDWGMGPIAKCQPGTTAISRMNWVIVPSVGTANGLAKIFLGVTYNDQKVPLWQIVQDLCVLSGLDASEDIDVTELTDLVQGYAVARPTTARAAIEPLMGAYFFDGVETAGE